MLEPSNPRPASKASSVSSRGEIVKCCHKPGRSTNRKSIARIPLSLMRVSTSAGFMVRLQSTEKSAGSRWCQLIVLKTSEYFEKGPVGGSQSRERYPARRTAQRRPAIDGFGCGGEPHAPGNATLGLTHSI